jgi:hypothetical protein
MLKLKQELSNILASFLDSPALDKPGMFTRPFSFTDSLARKSINLTVQ